MTASHSHPNRYHGDHIPLFPPNQIPWKKSNSRGFWFPPIQIPCTNSIPNTVRECKTNSRHVYMYFNTVGQVSNNPQVGGRSGFDSLSLHSFFFSFFFFVLSNEKRTFSSKKRTLLFSSATEHTRPRRAKHKTQHQECELLFRGVALELDREIVRRLSSFGNLTRSAERFRL